MKSNLVTLDAKQNTLKKELEQLGIQREQLHNSFSEIDENLANKQNGISRLMEEHVAIVQTPMLIDVNAKTLETLQEALRTQHDGLHAWCGYDCCVISFIVHFLLSFLLKCNKSSIC